MRVLTADEIIDLGEQLFEAEARGDIAEVKRLASQIPMPAGLALSALQSMGKRNFLELGYDTTLAQQEYGKDWLDRYATKP